ncbi:MAG: 3-hydroxybenzoate 4-monooxygenase, partial [Pseudomonadota bacterium]|nr:3-hydroxybenzoate 4-monooxygenase [Pseudomonadota bacterium]
RQAIAQNLIDFDREWAKLVSAPVRSESNPDGVEPAEVQKYFVQHGRYTAGTASRYLPSLLTGDGAHQQLAEGFQIGMRFHSTPVVRLADAKPVQLGHVVKADGRWRVFAFADKGDPAAETSAIRRLCNFLKDDQSSPVLRHTAAGEDIDAVIDLRAVFQQNHRDLTLERMPSLLLPAKGRYGLRDYEKMFCPDLKSGNDIFEMRGIDRDKGCLVIVRPDQYVAEVLPLDAHEALSGYFQGILKERR